MNSTERKRICYFSAPCSCSCAAYELGPFGSRGCHTGLPAGKYRTFQSSTALHAILYICWLSHRKSCNGSLKKQPHAQLNNKAWGLQFTTQISIHQFLPYRTSSPAAHPVFRIAFLRFGAYSRTARCFSQPVHNFCNRTAFRPAAAYSSS